MVKMLRQRLPWIMALGLVMTLPAIPALAAAPSCTECQVGNILLPNPVSYSVTVDGRAVNFSPYGQEPVNKDGRIMVPVRALANMLGLAINWNGYFQSATFTKGATTVVVTVGNTDYTVNGLQQMNDVAPFISGGRLLVPVGVITESFGYLVSWDAQTSTVIISTK